MNVFSPWTRQLWKTPAASTAPHTASRPKRKQPDRRPDGGPDRRVREPAKDLANEPAKEPAKYLVEELRKEPVKEPAKEPAKDPAKEPLTTVYGQDANMTQLRAWFAKPNYRAAVLWGASGVGKNMAAYSLSPHIVEFNALSTNVCAEL